MPLIPKDLQRFSVDGLTVCPQYIKGTPAVLQLMDQILDCFRFCAGDTYGMLQDTLEPLCLSSQRHRLIRGIIHLLEDRLEFDETLSVEPFELREKLFKQAAGVSEEEYAGMAWRERILKDVSQEYGISEETIEDAIYSDLKSERKILSFEDIEAEELVCEYNLALAKSLLLYAKSLTFTIDFGEEIHSPLQRRLFQSMKFFNLLFEVQQVSERAWQYTVDGPSAVLPQPQKYASSLAAFLPTLYLFKSWHATANIEINNKKVLWQLKPEDFEPPQIRHAYRLPEEAEALANRIVELDGSWEIDRNPPLIELGPQSIWIPDFSMRNRHTGATAYVEVMGFWRADYLNRRLKQLENAPKNLILVLSEKLKVDKTCLASTPLQIVYYKRTPRAQDIMVAASRCV